MDEVLVEALAQTPEGGGGGGGGAPPPVGGAALAGGRGVALPQPGAGRPFPARPRTAASEEIRAAWESFTQVLAADYLPRLQAAAGDDAAAGGAVTALTTYTSTSARLSSGEVPEFQDEAQAEQDIKMGRTPEANPEYQHDVEALTEAPGQLSECMPHWPVVC